MTPEEIITALQLSGSVVSLSLPQSVLLNIASIMNKVQLAKVKQHYEQKIKEAHVEGFAEGSKLATENRI